MTDFRDLPLNVRIQIAELRMAAARARATATAWKDRAETARRKGNNLEAAKARVALAACKAQVADRQRLADRLLREALAAADAAEVAA
ncbi:hypothetical protein HOU02_gp047 [Caulobacter phage CcrBL9]|uniref:Uncharacterized protein n=1 Tax=Caulobacter phage CcrBL9 TaxID=2283270 RepID=A0A385EAZ1_9CAUD|nr:hypothetical protein HOU02_gp047 [Caulobacter phage CcrBL9]AXQ69071.1 hypothetical protein CcrBL9_gp047c [Caulobacter phage CcrBL9]